MFKIQLLIVFLIQVFPILPAEAGIFGNDDRIDTFQSSGLVRRLGHSVPALINKKHLRQESEAHFLVGENLTTNSYCSDIRFAEEEIIANCTGSLITPRHVLTAAHCLSDYAPCEDYVVAFGYQRSSLLEVVRTLPSSDVYRCKKVIYHNGPVDSAIIELDRPVLDRMPVKLNFRSNLVTGDELTLIGYPMGISQKVIEGTKVDSVDFSNGIFRAEFDAFSVNSGGPVFDKDGFQIGIFVRGSSLNFTKRENANCTDWGKSDKDDYEEAIFLDSVEEKIKTLPSRILKRAQGPFLKWKL